MRIEYLVVELREGGADCVNLNAELDVYGVDDWEFVEWVETEWSYSNGPGPHSRRAIFKRITR